MTDSVLKKMSMVLTKESMNRIKISGANELTVDLHGLGTKDSLVLLNNIINLNRDECNIKVIHGFNHGTCLKDMVNGRFFNKRITKRTVAENNPGVTILSCVAAC